MAVYPQYISKQFYFILISGQMLSHAYLEHAIATIIDIPYENRSKTQHTILYDFLQPLFPTASPKKLKVMSFYFKKIKGPSILAHPEYRELSFVVLGLGSQNPQNEPIVKQIRKQKKITIKEGEFCFFLDFLQYLNCEVLAESSIEEEMSFFQTSEFFCSLPKKTLYALLRKTKVLSFQQSQNVYYEGQKIQDGESGSGVYLVRKGEFGYSKFSEKEGKQIQTYRFGKGHLFGNLQLRSGNSEKRVFSLKCKSLKGVVYHFSEDVFFNYIRPFCDHVIHQKQQKLFKYVSNPAKSEKNLSKMPVLSNTLFRSNYTSNSKNTFSISSQISSQTLLMKTKNSLPNISSFPMKSRLSQQLEEQNSSKVNYLSLMKEGPLKNYPLAGSRYNFIETQFKELKKKQREKKQEEKKMVMKQFERKMMKGEKVLTSMKANRVFEKEFKLHPK